jgi:hypothetical protein
MITFGDKSWYLADRLSKSSIENNFGHRMRDRENSCGVIVRGPKDFLQVNTPVSKVLPTSPHGTMSFCISTHQCKAELRESVKKDSPETALCHPDSGSQPFGSMPRRCSSPRRIRFIQVARDESPSLCISSSSCARNSSFKRMGNCGERLSGIDMVYTIGNILRVYTSVYALNEKKQRPAVLATHAGRLTSNRYERKQLWLPPRVSHLLVLNSAFAS